MLRQKNVDEKNRWAGSAVLGCRCLIIRVMALNSRALTQYGGGRGGVVSKIKRFRQTPLSNIDVMGRNYYFKKYCKILYLKKRFQMLSKIILNVVIVKKIYINDCSIYCLMSSAKNVA